MNKMIVHVKFEATASGLYCFSIRALDSYANMLLKLENCDILGLCHDRLGGYTQ